MSLKKDELMIFLNHVGARHCQKPLGRSVEQSFNKLVYEYCQNISSSVGMTKSRAFDYKSCQDSSSYVRMTKK